MTKTKRRSGAAAEIKPLTVGSPDAMRFLGIGRTTFDRLVSSETFTVITGPNGRGYGRRMFFRLDELEVFSTTRDPEQVRKFRKEKGRMK